LKKRFIKELTNEPEKLFNYIKQNISFKPPEEIIITFTKAKVEEQNGSSNFNYLYSRKSYISSPSDLK
jgi:hypothetical protein